MSRKPTKLMLDVRGQFSRLVIERVRNDYGNLAVAVRWGGAGAPVIVLEDKEALELAAALGRMANVA